MMADVEHVEVLDNLDKMSVVLYRSGISLFSIALLAFGVENIVSVTSFVLPSMSGSVVVLLLAISSALSAANVHVYNKYVRTVIMWSSWIGLILLCSDAQLTRVWLSVGFLFVTFSGIALKESFCFRVFGLKLVPILLALSVFLLMQHQALFAGGLMSLAGCVLAYLSWKKWQMPLHFDIGNKSHYQI